jgi:hypothetical protein
MRIEPVSARVARDLGLRAPRQLPSWNRFSTALTTEASDRIGEVQNRKAARQSLSSSPPTGRRSPSSR